ncbi:MAG: MFS transporter [Clostridium sp.]|nr:MFS transporter [Clostridium sp.]
MNKNFRNMIYVFMGFFFMSFFSNTLPPYITTIKNTYGVSNDVIAFLPSIVYLTSFIMSIVGAKLMYSIGIRNGLNIGFIMTIAASLIILFSKSFVIIIIGYFISGLAIGANMVFFSAMLSLLPKKYQKFSLANGCFGLGGIIISPIAAFILKNKIPFNYTYILHILIMILCIVIFNRIEYDPVEKGNSSSQSSLGLLKKPFILMLSFAIFFYVGAEISTTSWTGTFLEKYYGMSRTQVPEIMLGFWTLYTVGRFLGDILIDKFGQLNLLSILPIMAIVGIVITLSGHSTWQAFLGISFIGMSISVIYPAMQGFIVQHVDKDNVPIASSLTVIFNNLGATLLTYVVGFAGGIRILNIFIIQIFFYFYIALLCMLLLFKHVKKID